MKSNTKTVQRIEEWAFIRKNMDLESNIFSIVQPALYNAKMVIKMITKNKENTANIENLNSKLYVQK